MVKGIKLLGGGGVRRRVQVLIFLVNNDAARASDGGMNADTVNTSPSLPSPLQLQMHHRSTFHAAHLLEMQTPDVLSHFRQCGKFTSWLFSRRLSQHRKHSATASPVHGRTSLQKGCLGHSAVCVAHSAREVQVLQPASPAPHCVKHLPPQSCLYY